MKKIFSIIMVLCMLVCLSACGGYKKSEESKPAETTEEVSNEESGVGYDTTNYDKLGLKDYETVTGAAFIKREEGNNSVFYMYEMNSENGTAYAEYLVSEGWTIETEEAGETESDTVVVTYYKDDDVIMEVFDFELNETWVLLPK